jgi:hypothetical protein
MRLSNLTKQRRKSDRVVVCVNVYYVLTHFPYSKSDLESGEDRLVIFQGQSFETSLKIGAEGHCVKYTLNGWEI